jgi:hypothetical protein
LSAAFLKSGQVANFVGAQVGGVIAGTVAVDGGEIALL